MLRLGFRPTSRFALALATFLVGAVGCTAGVQQTTPTGGAAGTAGTGAGTAGNSATGLGGFIVGGRGGSATTGTGGTLPVPPGCGDGINNQGGIEVCDDGNTRRRRRVQRRVQGRTELDLSARRRLLRAFRCGDGVINPGEVCDDGNTADGDGCNATCTLQDPGYACTMPGMACTRTSICGNRRVEPGETCDDGNTTAGDGCSAAAACWTTGGPARRRARRAPRGALR